MPWCSGKVTVPLGCSTALVMNKRPGHAPQLPPAVAALAGMAIALAGMAMAISVMNPSAILTNLILRNVVIFIGCPFLWRGRQRSPLLRSPLLVCTAAQVLGLAGTPGRGEAAPPGANKRTRRARQAGAFAAAWRQASRGPERLRGHAWRTSPAVLVHSQRRTRRIPRPREAGQDQARTDQYAPGRWRGAGMAISLRGPGRNDRYRRCGRGARVPGSEP